MDFWDLSIQKQLQQLGRLFLANSTSISNFSAPSTQNTNSEIFNYVDQIHMPSDSVWTNLLFACRYERMEKIFLWCCDNTELQVSESQYLQLQEACAAYDEWERLLWSQTNLIVDLLIKEGIPVKVIKGPAIAKLDYAPNTRMYGDVDIIIRSSDIPATKLLLESLGGKRNYPELRKNYDQQFSKGINFSFAHHIEIDLHRTLCSGPYSFTIDENRLWEESEIFEWNGFTYETFSRPIRFVHACLHVTTGGMSRRWVSLFDVLILAYSFDLEEQKTFFHIIQSWKLVSVIQSAMDLIENELSVQMPIWLHVGISIQPKNYKQEFWLYASNPAVHPIIKSLAVSTALPNLRSVFHYSYATIHPDVEDQKYAFTNRIQKILPEKLRWKNLN